MDKTTLRNEAPDHKIEDTFFHTHDGRTWLLFGCTDDAILAREATLVDGRFVFATLASLPYDMFADWTDDTKADNNLNLSGRKQPEHAPQRPTISLDHYDHISDGQTIHPSQFAMNRPTIARSTAKIESASDKGYTPETSSDANIDLDRLGNMVAALQPLDQLQWIKLYNYCFDNDLDHKAIIQAIKEASR